MRIVVTGGAGFVGSHLCGRFISEEHDVICVDNLITGTLDNLQLIADHPRFFFMKHNVSDGIEIDGQVDFVLHFASPASPLDYLRYPIPTLKVGALGTHNALGLAKAKKAKFMIASTSEVYGDPQVHPQPESYWGNVNPVGPRGVYDEAKRFAEAITMAYHREHGIDTRIIRIFNTYGPRMRMNDGRAIPAFVSQALSGQPLTVFGDGSQTRSFCYIDDLVEGICRVMARGDNDPINLGMPYETTLKELAETIIRLSESKSTITYKPLPVDDPKVRKPDISKARSLLDWEPKVPLEEGLNKAISWFTHKVS